MGRWRKAHQFLCELLTGFLETWEWVLDHVNCQLLETTVHGTLLQGIACRYGAGAASNAPSELKPRHRRDGGFIPYNSFPGNWIAVISEYFQPLGSQDNGAARPKMVSSHEISAPACPTGRGLLLGRSSALRRCKRPGHRYVSPDGGGHI